ncbi:MAG: HEAT repeat domain-containing protein [Gemmataceae bacterium]|nr:HEAT repeat domain-containing protein [Gemmataceae bacterium]
MFDLLTIPFLVLCLDSDDFRTRAAAYEQLAIHGRVAVPHLKQAARQTENPEVRWRCHRLVEVHRPELLARLQVQHKDLRIDALPLEIPASQRWDLILRLLAGDRGGLWMFWSPPCGQQYTEATQRYIAELVYSRDEDDVEDLLTRMADRQRKYWDGAQWRDETAELLPMPEGQRASQ